jgi:hypothetical protein
MYLILKLHFLDMDEKEIENVNKGWHWTSKHVDLWAKNVFDEWQVFHAFSIEKLIINFFENESCGHVVMFCFISCKKRWYLISTNKVSFYLFCWILLFFSWTLNLIISLFLLCLLCSNQALIHGIGIFICQKKQQCVVELSKTLAVSFNIFIRSFIMSKLLEMKLLFERQLLVLEKP